MGFPREQAALAASRCGTVEEAVDWILARGSAGRAALGGEVPASDGDGLPARKRRRRPAAAPAAEVEVRTAPAAETGGSGGGGASSSAAPAAAQEEPGALETSAAPRACGLCAEDRAAWCTVRLPCAHGWYCVGCMQRHAEARLDLGGHEVPCPECSVALTQAVLRVVLPEATLQRLMQRSLEQAVGSSGDLWPCPTPNCANRVALEEGQTPRLNCEVCGREHCLLCHATPFHKGASCEQYAAARRGGGKGAAERSDGSEEFRKWMEQTGSRQCPSCRMAVSKQDLENQDTQRIECHKMICRNCGAKFCFRCLAALDSVRCRCTGANHGFIDPRTGGFVKHQLEGRGRRARQ